MSERDNLPSENDFLGLPVLSQSSSDERYRDGSNSLESIGPLYDLLDDDDRRGALSQGECSLPTGHDTPSDESVGNRSRCGSNDAVAEEPPEEFDLIDLEYQYSNYSSNYNCWFSYSIFYTDTDFKWPILSLFSLVRFKYLVLAGCHIRVS